MADLREAGGTVVEAGGTVMEAGGTVVEAQVGGVQARSPLTLCGLGCSGWEFQKHL